MESDIRVNGVGMHDVLACCSFKASQVKSKPYLRHVKIGHGSAEEDMEVFLICAFFWLYKCVRRWVLVNMFGEFQGYT